MSENVVEPTAGALPTLNAKDNAKVLGAPSSKSKSKSNVGKLFVLIAVLIGLLFIVVGLMWFLKGRKAAQSAPPPITLGAKANGLGEKNSAVDNAGIEKLKASMLDSDKKKQAEANDNASKLAAMAAADQAKADAAKASAQNGAPAIGGAAPAPGGAPQAPNGQGRNAPPRPPTPQERKYQGQVMVDYSGGKKEERQYGNNQAQQPNQSNQTAYQAAAVNGGNAGGYQGAGFGNNGGGQATDNLSARLQPTVLARREAGVLPNLDYLLKRGVSIPCALQTGIDTTLAGFVVCKVMSDVYSANGKTLLVERDATIFGEQQSALKQGQARTFILWTRIDNPSGVYAQVDSPGTDQMGFNGVPGYVDSHFWQRFGGAIMLSLVQDYGQVIIARESANSNGTAPTYSNTTNTTQNMAAEALHNTINIPPTLIVNPGTIVYVLVSRDVSFENVYTLIK